MNKKMIILGAITLVIGMGIGYAGAYAFHLTSAQNARGTFSAASGNAFNGMRAGLSGQEGAAGNGMLSGTVAKEDSGSITLNTRDGSSHVVLVTPATTVQKSVNGTLSDVAVGATIIVTGTDNSDGSVSASSIQLRPAMPPATIQK